jgi:hypothetical protein
MRNIPPLAERLAPDTVTSLERAAQQRFATAEYLRTKRRLAALYLYGYSAEICLAAAYYRSAGFHPNQAIDRDMRQRRMAQARQVRTSAGEPLMTGDPHPLIGWARFLQWHRSASGDLTETDAQRLREAINKAVVIYNHWRPELRYKTLEITDKQLDEVRRAAKWLIDNRERL